MKYIKSIYLRNIYVEIMKRKKILLVFVLLFATVFAVIGYKKGVRGIYPSERQEEKIQEYQNKIADYDNTISDLISSLELAQKQIDQLQIYVNDSIYMKLDSQNIYAASAQFAILNSGNISNILTSYSFYLNEGGLSKELSEEYGNVDTKYLKEIVISSIGGNVLNITVYHYEEEQAQRLLELIENCITKQMTQIALAQSGFKIQKISSLNYTKADVNVANTQNNNLNNLKNFLSNKVDLENKRIAQENNKISYIEKNESEITTLTQVNPFKEGIKFAVTGAVFGFLLLWLYHSMKYILGGQLKSKEDLISSNLTVINNYNLKKGYLPALDRVIMDMQLWAEQYKMSKVFIDVLSEDEMAKKVVTDYVQKISQINLSADTGYHVNDDVEELRNMVSTKYCIMVVQVGKTSYSQMNEQIAVCEKFGVKILGYVVVE